MTPTADNDGEKQLNNKIAAVAASVSCRDDAEDCVITHIAANCWLC